MQSNHRAKKKIYIFGLHRYCIQYYGEQTHTGKINLQPQDSFGEFNNFFLDLQKVQEIIRKHHQTFLQLFGMTYCNAILPKFGKLSLCT